MREIISIHVGETGLRVGQQYWQTLANEHALDHSSGQLISGDDSKTEHVNKVFDENSSGVYTPRAVFVDVNSLSFDRVLTDDSLLADWERVCGQLDKAGTFAEGKYNVVAQHKNDVNDAVQRELEKWDSLDTMLVFGSTCGGTGSAFFEIFSKTYKDFINFAWVPSINITSNPIELYNSLLSLASLYHEWNSLTIIADNYSAYNVYKQNFQYFNDWSKSKDRFKNVNDLLSRVYSDITSSARFSSSYSLKNNLLVNCKDYTVNSFSSCSFAWSELPKDDIYKTVENLTMRAFSLSSSLIQVKVPVYRVVTSSLFYRGNIPLSAAAEVYKKYYEFGPKDK